MHATTFLLPVLAVMAHAAPAVKPLDTNFGAMPGVGAGISAALASLEAAGATATAVPVASAISAALAKASSVVAHATSVHSSVSHSASAASTAAVPVDMKNKNKKVEARMFGSPVQATTTTTSSKSSSTTASSSSSTASSKASATSSSSSSSTSSAATNVNSACAVQPTGYGPSPTTDTDAAFTAYAAFSSSASAAATPTGYSAAFTNLHATVNMDTQMGSYILTSYNPATCAAYCSNTYGCQGFNIFFERDPQLNPAAGCANPASTTNIKCALFGSTIAASGFQVNDGQYRGPYSTTEGNFHVVIAGSNAYNLK